MSVQITIIGLGQIGSSMGLALAAQADIVRMGHDIDTPTAQKAVKIGAVANMSRNLFQAIKDADLVLLALPLDQIEETLTLIGEGLRENAVVMDTAPVKGVVRKWAEAHLPPGRHYVGLTPMLNPKYLHDPSAGIDGARADLFENGLMAIVLPPKVDPAAVQLAVNLTKLVKATPLFTDAAEVDGFMAATHTLPQILAAALVNNTVDQPGWEDGKKFAGRAYAQMTNVVTIMETPEALASACMQNRENITRVIDRLMDGLGKIRADISEQEEDYIRADHTRLNEARLLWWAERQAANWDQSHRPGLEMPKASDIFTRLIFGERRKPKRDD